MDELLRRNSLVRFSPTELEPDGRPQRLDVSLSRKIYVVPNIRGIVGYFGSEQVGRQRTHDWLTGFIRQSGDAAEIGEFARRLTEQVSRDTVVPAPRLGFFVVGPGPVGPTFWYVWNYSTMGPDTSCGVTTMPFQVRDELAAYITQAQANHPGSSEAAIRRAMTFQFRNGTLFPFIGVIRQLEGIIDGLPGLDSCFPRLGTIAELASYTLFKMEFVKRLYSKLGYTRKPPIDGAVTTLALDQTGLWQKHKNAFVPVAVRSQ